MERCLFGTDGIRGRANREPLTAQTMARLGRAIAALFVRDVGRPRLVLGRDTRISGTMLECAVASGAAGGGMDVELLGEVPTPAVADWTRHSGADAGAVISASHNPYEDNGVKLFGADGFKLGDSLQEEISRSVTTSGDTTTAPLPGGEAIGRVTRNEEAAVAYGEALVRQCPVSLDGRRIVVDCAHGAAWWVAPRVLESLGAEVQTIGVEPNGRNINERCGALFPEAVRRAVVESPGAIGIALDGDADRLLLVDEQGEIVDGDACLAILAGDGENLPGRTVVGTIMTNLGLEVALREKGIALRRTPVGDRYVVEEMRRGGFTLGGEPSGHILLLDRGTTGDGLLAALAVLSAVVDRRRPLSELRKAMTPFPQTLRNVPVARKAALDEIPSLRAAIEKAESDLGEQGRVIVRFSGTEPLVRVMVEGAASDRVEEHADQIAAALTSALGASR